MNTLRDLGDRASTISAARALVARPLENLDVHYNIK